MWSNNNYVNFCQQQSLNDAILHYIHPVAFNLSASVLHNPTQSSSEGVSACSDVWFSMMWCLVQGELAVPAALTQTRVLFVFWLGVLRQSG